MNFLRLCKSLIDRSANRGRAEMRVLPSYIHATGRPPAMSWYLKESVNREKKDSARARLLMTIHEN